MIHRNTSSLYPKQLKALLGKIAERSGAEEAFDGVYRNSAGDTVSFYMGYRSTAFLENENFFHSPTVCLPGSGWQTKKKTTHTITEALRRIKKTMSKSFYPKQLKAVSGKEIPLHGDPCLCPRLGIHGGQLRNLFSVTKW